MTPNEIDRIIHEARGLCWHSWEYIDTDYSYGSWDNLHKCTKCGVFEWTDHMDGEPANPSYTTSWEAWGKALEWARKQEWWERFITVLSLKSDWKMLDVVLTPLRGSTAFAEFIRANPQLFRKGE